MNVPAPSRLARYLTVVLRWLAITLVVFVLTILTGLFITDHLLPKVYTATAQVQIIQRGVSGGADLIPKGTTVLNFDPVNFQAECDTMESSGFLLPIIHDLGLDK